MNNTTRKHPRTMQEAFGPYTSGTLHEPADQFDGNRVFTLGLIMDKFCTYCGREGHTASNCRKPRIGLHTVVFVMVTVAAVGSVFADVFLWRP